jgi:hypothetical protein
MRKQSNLSIGTIAILVGWVFMIFAFIWQVAGKDAAYAGSIELLQADVEEIEVKINTTENFRINIVEQLTEIKTDLKWIKRKLDGTD